MKKFTKILAAVFALVCMVSAMAVTASAKSSLYVGASNNGQGFVYDSEANPKLQTGAVQVKAPTVPVPTVCPAPATAPAPCCCCKKDCGCCQPGGKCTCGKDCKCQCCNKKPVPPKGPDCVYPPAPGLMGPGPEMMVYQVPTATLATEPQLPPEMIAASPIPVKAAK